MYKTLKQELKAELKTIKTVPIERWTPSLWGYLENEYNANLIVEILADTPDPDCQLALSEFCELRPQEFSQNTKDIITELIVEVCGPEIRSRIKEL